MGPRHCHCCGGGVPTTITATPTAVVMVVSLPLLLQCGSGAPTAIFTTIVVVVVVPLLLPSLWLW